jgi:beta-galactosidase
MKKYFLTGLLAMLVAVCTHANERKTLLDYGWRFLQGDGNEQCSKPDFDDSKWRVLDLPHDWSIEGAPKADEPAGNDAGYRPTGKGWYRKTITLSKQDFNKDGKIAKRWSLYFEGVYMNAEVFVNGKSLGTHHYGYSAFTHDITDLLHTGSNTIAVSVDNSKQKNSRWYSGSGIYRHVWLLCTDEVHFKHWGTFITTPEVSSAKATVSVATEVSNDGKTDRQVMVNAVVRNNIGEVIGTSSKEVSIKAGSTVNVQQNVSVSNPSLWTPDTPTLYKAQLSITENGK